MDTEEIIEMAKQAGYLDLPFDRGMELKELRAFAKLIAQKEREACANICETLELPEWPDKVRQPLAKAIRARGQE